MATHLKDFQSHYDTLEIVPECTKTEIRLNSYHSCFFHVPSSMFLPASILSTGSTCFLLLLSLFPPAYIFNTREAWLRLSMMYHPDLNKDDDKATEKFMEVKEAYKGAERFSHIMHESSLSSYTHFIASSSSGR